MVVANCGRQCMVVIVVANNSKGEDYCSQWSLCCNYWHQCCSSVVSWHQWSLTKIWEFLKGFWKVEVLIWWWVDYFWKEFWKAELLVDWCLYEDLMGVQSIWSSCESVERVLKCANLNFNFEWNEGFDKGWLKNSYLSNVTSISGNLKFIENFFQRSTTSLSTTSSNFGVLEVKLRFEV